MILRLYKMIRITRLFKVYTEVTDETQASIFRNVLKIDPSVLRLSFFLLLFFLLCHFSACLWVIIAIINKQMQDPTDVNPEGQWLDNFEMYEDQGLKLYMVSFYWTITTISTVGYGDISANNFSERFFCSLMMLIGVISFSFANGSLSSILSQSDQKKKQYMQKLETLHKIQKQYKNLPPHLFQEMKKSLGYDFQKSNQEISQFVEQLPTKLKIEVNLFIHEERYKNIKFFSEKSNNFLSWTCPLLCPVLSMPNSYLYLEGDQA